MRLGELKVDFMPDDAGILGFSNQWYAQGIETAVTHPLTPQLNIKRLTPELFLATKLEAYLGRGNSDLITSRDIEDILLVVDGREELAAEVQKADSTIRSFIVQQFLELQEHEDFENFLTGNITGPVGRVDIVRDRFSAIAASDESV